MTVGTLTFAFLRLLASSRVPPLPSSSMAASSLRITKCLILPLFTMCILSLLARNYFKDHLPQRHTTSTLRVYGRFTTFPGVLGLPPLPDTLKFPLDPHLDFKENFAPPSGRISRVNARARRFLSAQFPSSQPPPLPPLYFTPDALEPLPEQSIADLAMAFRVVAAQIEERTQTSIPLSKKPIKPASKAPRKVSSRRLKGRGS